MGYNEGRFLMKVCALNYLEEQTFVLSASNLLVSFKHKTLRMQSLEALMNCNGTPVSLQLGEHSHYITIV